MELKVEANQKFVKAKDAIGCILFTPPIGEDYWTYRVVLHKDQAIVCFPKFCTIGCGFAQEKDWNTNLPLSCDAEEIYDHIKHNKKYKKIADDDCLEAIRLLQRTLLAPARHPDPQPDKDGA